MTGSEVGPVFWVLAAVILLSGLLVVSLRNIFHCALFLIICLSGVAGIYILLGAEFLAAAQVLIYVGAVAILMIFAVMLTHQLAGRKIRQTNRYASVGVLVALLFALGARELIVRTPVWKLSTQALPEDVTLLLGRLLLTTYMLPFEVVSVLLLAALIGAVMLARGEGA